MQRMHHVASYSQQMLIISGGTGAGKSTLATALASTFEDYNSALVVCPMHADDAEIRRKILVQLLTNPLFDDDVPLADTLLRLSPALSKPLHIILDDAHLLSPTLWAECIILSQLSCAGRAIAVTVTTEPNYINGLMRQLTEANRQQLLPISIEPLDIVEREALYYTLLSRSERNPFTPREIVRSQLEKQKGTPQEVVTLLDLALHGEAVIAKVWWRRHWLAYMSVLLILASLPLGWMYYLNWSTELDLHSQYELSVVGDLVLKQQGKRYLAPYLAERSAVLAESLALVDNETTLESNAFEPKEEIESKEDREQKDELEQLDESAQSTQFSVPTPTPDKALTDNAAAVDVESASIASPSTFNETPRGGHQETDSQTAAVEPGVVPQHAPTFSTETIHGSGYVLQVASVKKLASLQNVLVQLQNFSSVRVAKHKQQWVVLLGDYPDLASAKAELASFSQKSMLSTPWLRKWTDVSDYELQQSMPTREIYE